MHKAKRITEKNRRKKSAPVLLSGLLICALAITPVIAMLIDFSNPITNEFRPGSVGCVILEYDETGMSSFENGVSTAKTNVSLQNTGTASAYIRAAVAVNWQDANGAIYGQAPVAGTDYVMEYATNTGWDLDTSDGFFYYQDPVGSSEQTGVLIRSCSPVEGRAPEGYSLHVEIIGSAIQSQPITVVTDSWGVTLSGDRISK